MSSLYSTFAAAEEESPSVLSQFITASVVLVPLFGFVAAVYLTWGHGFGGWQLCLLLGMYAASGFGITIGYHRLFTHQAFETNRVVRAILVIFGGMAFQGPILKWVAMHRRHHLLSDRAGDPHSPHLHGENLRTTLAGVLHSHVGWVFDDEPEDLKRHVGELLASRLNRALNSLWPLWAIAGLIIPAILGGLITRSWAGVVSGFLWSGLARVFLVHHITWSINSVCHVWGARPFRCLDQSRNNLIFGLLGLGEGWHNNHHAFPTSARHGLSWWQFDISYIVIRFMQFFGLAWNVRVPSAVAMTAKRA
jgi:stearoyl-CoA desaturase (delta-9 desaturase)